MMDNSNDHWRSQTPHYRGLRQPATVLKTSDSGHRTVLLVTAFPGSPKPLREIADPPKTGSAPACGYC